MKLLTGATPLIAVDATAVDTETTGLDSARARIVALGAVPISGGKVADGQTLDLLVNPGEPIPVAAARIHGITDEKTRTPTAFPRPLDGYWSLPETASWSATRSATTWPSSTVNAGAPACLSSNPVRSASGC